MVDNAFFEQIVDAEKIIRPLIKASFVMQRDCNTLADVLNMFGLLYQSFGKSRYEKELQGLLEKRWNQQEQPIFLLAYMFHPKYAKMFRDMTRNQTNLDLGKVLIFCILYYKKYICDLTDVETRNFSPELNDWYRDAIPEAKVLKNLPPTDFWNALKQTTPHCSRLAIFLLSIVAQTATCERLFSTLGNFGSKKRNKLHPEKMHYLAQVKRSVAVMDEKNTKQMRILNSKELPRVNIEEEHEDIYAGNEQHNEVTELNNSIEVGDDSDEEDGSIESNDDMEVNGASDEEDDTDEHWKSVFDKLNELDRIDDNECNTYIDYNDRGVVKAMMNEALELKYSEGNEHRQNHPYPNYNDTSFPQERLKGIRQIKFQLKILFPASIEVLDDFKVFE